MAGPTAWFLAGGGETGALMRAYDWSASPLGPSETWPSSLRTAVGIMLGSNEPLAINWGTDFAFLYNDAASLMIGNKHPSALGQSGRIVFSEAWDLLGPVLTDVIAGKGSFTVRDQQVAIERRGFVEKAWFDYTYTPIPSDDGSIGGVFIVTAETTDRVEKAHRDAFLTRLKDTLRSLSDVSEVMAAICEMLGDHLGIDRCGYGETDASAEHFAVDRCWTRPGIPGIEGQYRIEDYGKLVVDSLWSGEPYRCDDIASDDRFSVRDKAIHLELGGMHASLMVPLLKQGRPVSGFFLQQREPRVWTDQDVELLRDITQHTWASLGRVRAEAALRQMNADLERRVASRGIELDRVWRNAQDLQVVIDGDGVFLAVSPSATRLLGWTPEEMVGQSLFAFTLPDGHQGSREALRQAASEALPPHRNCYRHKDGSHRWISWITTPENGLIYCYGRDVTVEVGQARSLLQAEDALRQSQKLEAIGQLTGGVAHDFNNLLTVIKSSTDLLKRPDLPEERRNRYVAAISDTVDRAARLTGQLLAFARRQTLQPEVFAACDGVRAITEMVGTLTGSRIRLITDLPTRRAFINADPSQFDTALVNLAVNARDAMEGEGQITIAVRAVETMPAIRTHEAVEGPYVSISLGDTGSGIAPEKLEQIFEPFFTTKEVGKGTGLGLSQVFGFAKQSGGDVMVESAVGEGTTFTLYLPRVAEEERKMSKALGPNLLTVGHGTCVLVVEDNADVGSFSAQALIELGYLPILAASGEEALRELAKDADRFDVVFSDVIMPGMSGIDLAKEIRMQHPDLPVVLTSGYSHVLAQEGTHGFEVLQKPYSIEQLSRTLHAAAMDRQGDRIHDA